MKRISLISIVLLFFALQLLGQSNTKIFSSLVIVWVGIDFSKAKMIGADGFTDPVTVAKDFPGKWNSLVLDEVKKYDIGKAYQKEKVVNRIEIASQQNSKIDPESFVIETAYKFKEGDVDEIVKNYKGLESQGAVGVVYIVEYFSKPSVEASIYVVFFDLDSQEILHLKNYITKPKGFGLRNYWADTIYNTIEESGKDYKKALKAL